MRTRSRWGLVLMLYAVILACYLLTGVRSARIGCEVPLTFLDQRVPQNLFLTLIYLGYFPYLMWVLLAVSRRSCFRRHILPTLSIAFSSLLIFVLLPTRGPSRELGESSGWTEAILGGLHAVDPAGNAFPSLHVSLAIFASYLAARHRIMPAYLGLGVAVAIMISTLSTGQHLVLDIAGGAVLAGAGYVLDRRGTHCPHTESFG